MACVRLSNCLFSYGPRPVVSVESLDVRPGRCLGVFGPNGAGKTTLVRGIIGLMKPARGTIRRDRGLRIGYLPQARSLQMHWPMSGLDAAAMACTSRQRLGWLGRARSRVIEAMTRLEVDALAHTPFAKLSGGQQQRILLAGALADEPDLLVLDEPTDGLDVRSSAMLLETLRRQMTRNGEEGLSVIFISHEVQDLLAIADSVAFLHPGDWERMPSRVELLSSVELSHRLAGAEGERA